MKKILFFYFLSSIIIPAARCETIRLKSGEVIEANIIEKTDSYIKVDFSGVPLTYFRDDIESIGQGGAVPAADSASVPDTLTKTPAQIFDQYASSVVYVEAKRPYGSNGGIGTIVSTDGLIVTNFHVVGGSGDFVAVLGNGNFYRPVSIVGYDPAMDICVFKINAPDLKPVPLGNSAELESYEDVIVVYSSREGRYNYITGKFIELINYFGRMILRNSVHGEAGFSGSPLFDKHGEMVGVYKGGQTDLKSWRIAVPIDEVKKVISQNRSLSVAEFVADADKAYLFYEEGDRAYQDGDKVKAAELYQKSIALKPDLARAYNDLAVCYMDMQQYPAALRQAQKAVELAPDTVEALCNMGAAYGANNLFNETLDTANKAIQMAPDYPTGYYLRGLRYIALGQPGEAKQEFEKALSVEENYCDAYSALAALFYDAGKFVDAQEQCAKAKEHGCEIPQQLLEIIYPR